MAVKKKQIDLGRSMEEFDKNIEAQKVNAPNILETLAPIEQHAPKKEVKVFDRKKERPDQKCIHFDRLTTMRVNEIKNWKSILGEKTTVEDIVYDAVQEYLAKYYEAIKTKFEQTY
ncbi:MAG: hypothetical protein KBT33_13030 [Prevotellaceae bacterium]|nr:hypothetical protein [Candidatus Minthosoma equi]